MAAASERTGQHRPEIQALLHSLRQQAIARGVDEVGSHQLDAHWSLAYACGESPEPWEMYRIPRLHLMPETEFYTTHALEIQEALKPKATWEFLQTHAVGRFALEASMSERERKSHRFPGKVQYYDFDTRRWVSVNIPSVRWFDGREVIRESVARTKDEFRATVEGRLAKLKEKAEAEPTPKRLAEHAAYEAYVAGQFQLNLTKLDANRRAACAWLAKLDATPDFAKALFALLRQTENEVRAARSIPAVGEAWVSETELLYRVRELLPGVEVMAHGQPKWLARQHLDIWIPSFRIGIEYHGLQHFQSVEFFGGEEAFRRVQARDSRKRSLCEKNGVRLVEIAYDQKLDAAALRLLLSNVGT